MYVVFFMLPNQVPNSSPTAASASYDIYGSAGLDACEQIYVLKRHSELLGECQSCFICYSLLNLGNWCLNSSAIYLIVADIIRTFCLLCGHFYDHHLHFEYGPLLEFKLIVETNMVLIYIWMSWCMLWFF